MSQRFNTLGDDSKFTDSIIAIIKTTKDDSIRSYLSFKISDLYRRNNDIKKFEEYLAIGNKYAFKYPYLLDLSEYFNVLKYINEDTDKYAQGIISTLKKIKKHRFKLSYEWQAILLQNLSLLSQIKDNEKECMRILTDEAVPVALKSENPEILGGLYEFIAITMMNNNHKEKAALYFQKAMTQLENVKAPSPILLETKIETTVFAAENLIRMDKLPDAKELLDKTFLILKKHPESNMNGIYYFTEGFYHHTLKNYHKAIQVYEKGIENAILNNDIPNRNRLKYAKYQSLYHLKKYNEAVTILIDLEGKKELLIEDKKKYYIELSRAYEKLKDYKKAYLYSTKFIELNDSIVDAKTKNEILALETKFNKIENDKKINELEAEKKQAELIAKNNQLYYLSFGGFSLLLLFIISLLWKNNKAQKHLTQEKEINYIQNLKLLNDQKEMEVMQAMIDSAEAERKRVARDLHDGIGSRLSVMKMKLNQIPRLNYDDSRTRDFSVQLSNSIAELKQISYNLMPETLLKLGLEAALKDLCHSLSSEKISINFQSNRIVKSISEKHQITIFRIVQELINNALKHSDCSYIIVDCNQNKNLFLITVEDNGIGFNRDDLSKFTGLGLKNVKNRIDLLNGKLEVKTQLGQGTVYNIEFLL